MKTLFDYTGKADADEINRLLAGGADVNAADKKGRTSFMMAACFGYHEAAEALFAAGANINAQDEKGNTAIMYAAYAGLTKTVINLIEKGSNLAIRDHKGGSAATAILENPSMPIESSIAMIKLFLGRGYTPNDQDEANAVFYDTLVDWRESQGPKPT